MMLPACDSDALLGPGAAQGIAGLVLIGPQCPVETEANPCPDLPHQATIEIREQGGAFVTNVRSGSDGTFRVGLRPGAYTLRPESGRPLPTAADQDVTVVAGSYTEVTIHYDTGIR
ncbi:MAG: carboxypeptidase-like regulatory domain-containing protein [Gemmatimonadota bacterium]